MTICRWVRWFTPLLIDAARSCRYASGDRWFVDEISVTVAGRWVYWYRAIDQFGQVIDVLVSQKRDVAATRRFVIRALERSPRPTEVIPDWAPAFPRVVDVLLPAACHVTERYVTNPVEADHGRLKARLRPMRGLTRLRSAQVPATSPRYTATTIGWKATSPDAGPRSWACTTPAATVAAPDGSWCEIDLTTADNGSRRIREGGPTSLWAQVEHAYQRWPQSSDPTTLEGQRQG